MEIKEGRQISKLDTKATGQRIKSLMYERGFSTQDISRIMKISFQAVYRWQRGESLPNINNLFILGQLFGTDVDDILVPKHE